MDGVHTPHYWTAATREVISDGDATVVRHWLVAPPRRVAEALAKAADEEVARVYGGAACAVLHQVHPESSTVSVDVRIPLPPAEAASVATALLVRVAQMCAYESQQFVAACVASHAEQVGNCL